MEAARGALESALKRVKGVGRERGMRGDGGGGRGDQPADGASELKVGRASRRVGTLAGCARTVCTSGKR